MPRTSIDPAHQVEIAPNHRGIGTRRYDVWYRYAHVVLTRRVVTGIEGVQHSELAVDIVCRLEQRAKGFATQRKARPVAILQPVGRVGLAAVDLAQRPNLATPLRHVALQIRGQ
jgi:hypothetical protein